MCVSTGKAGCPKPWDITTLAVLCPTPGSISNSNKFSGTSPSYFSTRIRDSSEIATRTNNLVNLLCRNLQHRMCVRRNSK